MAGKPNWKARAFLRKEAWLLTRARAACSAFPKLLQWLQVKSDIGLNLKQQIADKNVRGFNEGTRGTNMTLHEMPMDYWYDYRLVALSVVIAMFASFAALDLAGRTAAALGRARRAWLAGGATAMGMGIWSMHYIGMLAYHLPLPVLYDVPTVFVSLFAAIFSSAIALLAVSRKGLTVAQAVTGSVVMGSGIATMHYIGMAAMRMQGDCHYDLTLVTLSVVIAIVVSMVALWLAFHFRKETRGVSWPKVSSAAVMGIAICSMHYTGMAAASFTPASTIPDTSHAVQISTLGTVGITLVTMMVLSLAVLSSVVDRRFSAQTIELEASEERYRQLFERSLAGVYRSTLEGEILDVNDACSHIFGYDSREEHLQHRAGDDYLQPSDRESFLALLKERKTLTNFERCL